MTTIFWAGDSTAAHNFILSWPQTGIAQMFDRFLDRENVRISNHAVNGRSTKSFLDQGRLKPIAKQLKKGDHLFIHFGHNDEKESDPDRYTDPDTTFAENLKIFADCAREKGAVPVIISPVTRRGFTDPAALYRHDRWAAAARRTAEALNVAFIDLTRMSEELLIHTPHEKLDDWFMPDGTHLKPEGALMFAGLIAKGLYRLDGGYRKLLFGGFEEYLQKGKERKHG